MKRLDAWRKGDVIFMILWYAAVAYGEVVINVGDSIQQVVDAHPAGTTFLLKAGMHRNQEVNPRLNDTFKGEVGPSGELLTILNGAIELKNWRKEGLFWVHDVPALNWDLSEDHISKQYMESNGNLLSPDTNWAVRYRHDLYRDGDFMRESDSLSNLNARSESYIDYDAKKAYVFADPTGHSVEMSLARYAFDGRADNVVIRDMIVEKYACYYHIGGAIGGIIPGCCDTSGSGWRIEGTEIRYCHGLGICFSNTRDWAIKHNYIHHIGVMGVAGGGNNVLFEGNHLAYNGMPFIPLIDPGGTKFSDCDSLIARGNYSHHNLFCGLWLDWANRNFIIERNIVEWNTGLGISHEVNYGGGIIRCNIVKNNGMDFNIWVWGAGIQVSASCSTDIYYNILEVNADFGHGIIVLQNGDRGERYLLRENNVHHNDITYKGDQGLSGAAAALPDTNWYKPYGQAFLEPVYYGGGNRFDYNSYHTLNPNSARWVWAKEGSDGLFPRYPTYIDWSQFTGEYGQEVHGTVDTDTGGSDNLLPEWCDSCGGMLTKPVIGTTGTYTPGNFIGKKHLTLGSLTTSFDNSTKLLRVSLGTPVSGPVKIVIFNMLGRQVAESQVDASCGTFNLSFKNRSNSVFFVSISTPVKHLIRRVVTH